MTALDQEHLDVPMVSDDPVVDDEELVVLVAPLRMTVDLVRNSVCRPPSVSNTCRAVR